MALVAADKLKIVKSYKQSDKDTGSPEVQVALLTERIKYLTGHFKTHKKDNHSRYGLQALVNKRRSLLGYLKKKYLERYQQLSKRLKLRDTY